MKAQPEKMKTQYRQGDVLIVATDKTPSGPPAPRENGKVVLAHGEVTGHAHAIAEPGASLHPGETDTLLDVTDAIVMLRHEEHDLFPLTEGRYEVIPQMEYTPEAIRNVAD